MDKNCYIENVLNISGLDFVVWNDCRDTDEEFGIPHRVYTFMESFYQTLSYEDILNGNKILQIETALGVCNLLIPGENQIYVAGPYLTERTSTADFFSNLINNNLPIEYEINVFYQSLSVSSGNTKSRKSERCHCNTKKNVPYIQTSCGTV